MRCGRRVDHIDRVELDLARTEALEHPRAERFSDWLFGDP
jgi:hypothetical protein